MIEIITAHEADQLIATRKPLWGAHPTCNGNCQAGRGCDCIAPVVDQDDYREPMPLSYLLLAVALLAGSWSAVYFIVQWARS